MAKSKSPQPPEQSPTNIQIVCEQPIIIPRDPMPMEESPLPESSSSWPRFIFAVGCIAVLAFVLRPVPGQIQTWCQNLIQQVLQMVQLP